MPDQPIRILFLCTGNSARSQIAEALLSHKAPGRFVVGSAGTHPAPMVHLDAERALANVGIDWSGRCPKTVESVMGQRWDLVVTVCDDAKESCPLFPGRALVAHWGMPDPAAITDPAARERAFAATVSVLSSRLDQLLAIRHEKLLSPAGESRLREIGSVFPGQSATTA